MLSHLSAVQQIMENSTEKCNIDKHKMRMLRYIYVRGTKSPFPSVTFKGQHLNISLYHVENILNFGLAKTIKSVPPV